MPVKKIVKVTAKKASAKKEAPLRAAVKTKAKKRSAVHSVHIIERDFIIITSGGFLVVVMVVALLFS